MRVLFAGILLVAAAAGPTEPPRPLAAAPHILTIELLGQWRWRGAVEVIDGDTLRLGRIRLRIAHVDAPERDEPGYSYATLALDGLLAGFDWLDCVPLARDRYGRQVMDCRDTSGLSLGHWLVGMGAARARDAELHAIERQAQQERRGLWKCALPAPENWQRLKRAWCPGG